MTKTKSYSITVDTAVVYKVRCNDRFGDWCTAAIRGWKGGGSIDVQSDNGNYAYSWSAIGDRTITEFLAGTDYSYFMGKTHAGNGRMFCCEKSIEALKNLVIEARYGREIYKDKARDVWNEIEELEHTYSRDDYARTVFERIPWVADRTEWDIPSLTIDDPHCRRFWDGAWQALCEHWKHETAAEAA